MRRFLPAILFVFFAFGCSSTRNVEPAVTLRNKLLQSNGCEFQMMITADYGENIYTFTMDCRSDKNGNVNFTVIEPETISGITGEIDNEGGKLTFNEKILAFPLLADEQLTPVSVPWLFVRMLYSGYIGSGGSDGDYYKVQMDDSYENDPLRADVWLNESNDPIHCDFLWNNRRIFTAKIENFRFL